MIYFARAGKRVKVGYTNDIGRRLSELQTGSSELLILLGTIPGTMAFEKAIHELLADYRTQGEWFEHHGKCRQFVKLMTDGARPEHMADLCLLWEFTDSPHRIAAAKATIANLDSTPEELRDAHILLRDLTR